MLATVGLGATATSAGAVSDSTAVSINGSPLTVYIGPRGECQSSYLVNGKVQGNFFPGGEPYAFSAVADCGFFLAFPTEPPGQPASLKGRTFGFEGNAGPSGLTNYTPGTQSEVTGAGTEASPYSQITTFKVTPGLKEEAQVTERTEYVNGAPQFTSTFSVTNVSGATIFFRAMYAGDLFVNGSDLGTGVFLAGPPRFIGGQNTKTGVLGGLQEQQTPLPAERWSAFEELPYPTVWSVIQNSVNEAKAFNNNIEPNEVDNAAGVEWDHWREIGLPNNATTSFSVINRTQIPSALQFSPANQTLTQGQTATISVKAVDTANQPYAGKSVRYTISGANPQAGSVVLNSAGQAAISYVGKNPGIDTVQMFVDLAGNGVQTTSDPAGTAVVTFVPLPPPPPTPNSTYKIQSVKANPDGTITITFVPVQGGTATLEVTVPTGTIARKLAAEAKKKKCKKGLVKIKGKCRPATTVSGRVSAAGVAGVPLTLTVKPSSKVAKALKKGKKVVLTATLTYKSALGGTPTVTVMRFTVKPKKKHHH